MKKNGNLDLFVLVSEKYFLGKTEVIFRINPVKQTLALRER